jgi:hypothetical protein
MSIYCCTYFFRLGCLFMLTSQKQAGMKTDGTPCTICREEECFSDSQGLLFCYFETIALSSCHLQKDCIQEGASCLCSALSLLEISQFQFLLWFEVGLFYSESTKQYSCWDVIHHGRGKHRACCKAVDKCFTISHKNNKALICDDFSYILNMGNESASIVGRTFLGWRWIVKGQVG